MEHTLAIIKPEAFKKDHTASIISQIDKAGFKILALKTLLLNTKEAESFYSVHKDKPFFTKLIEFMTSGKIVVLALEKDNAVSDLRSLLGSTDPAEAKEGTIRKLYGTDKTKNAVHGSDSVENGKLEVSFFFSGSELIV
jgi:nucleoside-diphosphate kinase